MTITEQTDNTRRTIIENAPAGFLYQRIIIDLCRRIYHEEWAIGAKLPNRHELANDYGVGLNTLQPAIAHLLSVGVLTTINRQGTFVARQPVPTDYAQHDVTATLPVHPSQKSASSVTTRTSSMRVGILALGEVEPPENNPASTDWTTIVTQAFAGEFELLGGHTIAENITGYADNHFSIGDTINAMRSRGAQLLVLLDMNGYAIDRVSSAAEYIQYHPLPLLRISGEYLPTPLPLITYDQFYAGFEAMRHLQAYGYREVMFFQPYTAAWVNARVNGVRAAHAQSRMADEALQIYPNAATFSEQDYFLHAEPDDALRQNYRTQCEAVAAFVSGGTQRAVIAPNDEVAVQVIETLRPHGLQEGRDYGVIGFDDAPLSWQYKLTTLRPPLETMGITSARLAVDMLQGKSIAQTTLSRSQLVVRATTRPQSY